MSPKGSGTPAGFEELYEAHWRLVITIGMSILRDPQLAEDAAQETWIRIARSMQRGETPRRPGAWIARFARNEALRLAARGRGPIKYVAEPVLMAPHETAPGGPATGSSHGSGLLEAGDDPDLLVWALERLDAGDRHLLTRRYLEGCSPAVLARELSLSRTGVWKRLKAALGRLEQAIEAARTDTERKAGG